jgi:hypothetical protein
LGFVVLEAADWAAAGQLQRRGGGDDGLR